MRTRTSRTSRAVAQDGKGSVEKQRKIDLTLTFDLHQQLWPDALTFLYIFQNHSVSQDVLVSVDGADVASIVSVCGIQEGQADVSGPQEVFVHLCSVAVKTVLVSLVAAVNHQKSWFWPGPLHWCVLRKEGWCSAGQDDRIWPFSDLDLLLINWEEIKWSETVWIIFWFDVIIQFLSAGRKIISLMINIKSETWIHQWFMWQLLMHQRVWSIHSRSTKPVSSVEAEDEKHKY